jgi:hypothetical protein
VVPQRSGSSLLSARSDPNSSTSTQPVGKADSRIRIRADGFVGPGDPETITAGAFGLKRSAGTITGTVMFSIVGDSGRSTEVVTATYNGDATFNASAAVPKTVTVR